jgi:hypothetical protein
MAAVHCDIVVEETWQYERQRLKVAREALGPRRQSSPFHTALISPASAAFWNS